MRLGQPRRVHFECPADLDLDRGNVRQHLAFGFGTHHCLGAPLARRELNIGFRALVDRVEPSSRSSRAPTTSVTTPTSSCAPSSTSTSSLTPR